MDDSIRTWSLSDAAVAALRGVFQPILIQKCSCVKALQCFGPGDIGARVGTLQ